MSDWHGLVKILNIQHIAKDGTILWEDSNLKNILHTEGEEFILTAMFTGGNNPNTVIPNNFHFGLDDRDALAAADVMNTIVVDASEPSTNGYIRQSVASTGQFTVNIVSSVNQADSPIVTFNASGGSWGPVSNLFLTDKIDNTGFLIASVALSQTITVSSGESVSMRMGLSLKDCP